MNREIERETMRQRQSEKEREIPTFSSPLDLLSIHFPQTSWRQGEREGQIDREREREREREKERDSKIHSFFRIILCLSICPITYLSIASPAWTVCPCFFFTEMDPTSTVYKVYHTAQTGAYKGIQLGVRGHFFRGREAKSPLRSFTKPCFPQTSRAVTPGCPDLHPTALSYIRQQLRIGCASK